MLKKLCCLLLIAFTIYGSGCKRALKISVKSQLGNLSDLDFLCSPVNGISGMESTFDRQGGNADWWNIPPPINGSDLYEAVNLKGPGCVTRIWFTNIPATEWLFYFDEESEPRLTLESSVWGEAGRTNFYPLLGSSSGGAYSYIPISYAKSLSIQFRMPGISKDARPYFHINYTKFPDNTKVETWKAVDPERETEIAKINKKWRKVINSEYDAVPDKRQWGKRQVAAGKSEIIGSFDGAGRVTDFSFKILTDKSDSAYLRSLALRGLVLEAYWDGSKLPSIRVPVGDFFCNGMHPRDFHSLLFSNVNGTYCCRIPMPFRQGAKIVIRNDLPVEIGIETSFTVERAVPSGGMYLHAAFNDALSSGKPFTIARTRGCGKYIGCYLIALGMDGTWNILEGDEMFYRDGSNSAVIHGTGLEDYFNGGWYYFGLFELPLHGLLEKGAMRTAQYRFHLNDAFDFHNSMRMDIEFGDGNNAGGYLSAVAFWYQTKPVGVESTIKPLNQRFPPFERIAQLTIMDELFELERMGLVKDAMNRSRFYAEALKDNDQRAVMGLRALAYQEMLEGYDAVSNGYAVIAASSSFASNVVEQARMLLWRGQKPGRAIVGAHAYGIYRVFIDGEMIGEGDNPFNWRAWPVELNQGEHFIEVEIVPQQPQAFFSAGLSSFFTNIVSDVSWDYLDEGDDVAGQSEKKWRPYEVVPSFFPTMIFWQFEPNPFPFVQSGQQQGGPHPKWNAILGRPIRLRRRFEVPEPGSYGDRPPMPARRYMVVTDPVRPRDDISNQGISHGLEN